MALSLGNLEIELTANTSSLRRAEREVDTTTQRMERSFNRVGGAIAAAFSFEAVRRITLATDELNVLQRRLVRFTGSADAAEKTFKRLSQTASAVGQTVGNISSVFERFSLIRNEIGATNEQIIVMTDTLAKLGALGGSSSEEVNNALRQLAQGLAGGVIRAEEFNSIIEQTPEIARAIGAEMGLSMGQMRQAMLDGQLTSEKVFEAILKSAKKTNDEFEKMPKSISQTAQALKNNLLTVFLELEKKTGVIESLAELFGRAADELSVWNGTAEDSIQLADEINQLRKKELDLTRDMAEIARSRSNARKSEIDDIRVEREEVRKLIEQKEKELVSARTGKSTETTVTITGKGLSKDELEAAESGLTTLSEMGETPAERAERLLQEELEAIRVGRENKLRTQEEFDSLEIDAHLRHQEAMTDITQNAEQMRLNQQMTALNNMDMLMGNVNELIRKSGKEGSAIAKAAFLAQKAIAVAQILVATEQAAANAAAVSAIGGPVGFFSTKAGIRATGYASAGLVAGMAIGEVAGAFEQGGIVPGSSFTGDNMIARVNSGEMILNKSQQSKLFAMANGGGGSSTPNISIVNNGTPMAVENMSVSRDEITLMINDANKRTVKQIDNSLASGRGTTAQSLQKGFRAERRI